MKVRKVKIRFTKCAESFPLVMARVFGCDRHFGVSFDLDECVGEGVLGTSFSIAQPDFVLRDSVDSLIRVAEDKAPRGVAGVALRGGRNRMVVSRSLALALGIYAKNPMVPEKPRSLPKEVRVRIGLESRDGTTELFCRELEKRLKLVKVERLRLPGYLLGQALAEGKIDAYCSSEPLHGGRGMDSDGVSLLSKAGPFRRESALLLFGEPSADLHAAYIRSIAALIETDSKMRQPDCRAECLKAIGSFLSLSGSSLELIFDDIFGSSAEEKSAGREGVSGEMAGGVICPSELWEKETIQSVARLQLRPEVLDAGLQIYDAGLYRAAAAFIRESGRQ